MFKETLHVWLDEKTLKIAQGKLFGGTKQITGVFYKSIDGLSPDAVANEIRNGVASFKTSLRRLAVVLPSKYAMTKNIEVPSLDPDEIENIIRLQAVRHTPYSKQEVIVGHVNLERILERYTKVLLVIVANENIRKKTDLIELAGFEVESVHLASDVLVKTAEIHGIADTSQSPTGLVYLENEFTDFLVLHNGKPYFIRSIPIGFSEIKKNTASLQKLLDELKNTNDAYQNEDQGIPVKRLIILGSDVPAKNDMFKGLKESFGIPTEMATAEKNLPIAPEARSAMAASAPVDFLDVFSDAFAGEDPTVIDLLPDDLKVRRSFRRKGKEIFSATIFILLILAFVIGTFLTKIYFRNSYLQELTKNFEMKQKEVSDLELISDQTRLAREFSHKRGVALRVLNEFQNVLPEEMYLSEMALTDDEKISIKGTSNLMSIVFSFVTELENSPLFKNVTSDYTKSRKENDKDVSDFGLSAVLEGNTHGG